MLTDRDAFELAGGEPDPATPGLRAGLARALLLSAIRRYDEAAARWTRIQESYPRLARPRAPRDDAEMAEHRAWVRLQRDADDDFDGAELALASRIQALYDLLAPEGRRADDPGDAYFLPRAVRHGGRVYVLADDVYRYEPHANFIAVYREPMTLDLDGEAIADDA